MTWTLRANVGRDAVNLRSDVRIVQILLNRFQPRYLSLLRVNGSADHRTICAIEKFRRRAKCRSCRSGAVD